MPAPAATQLFAVRRALVELLAARDGLAGVKVTYGWPGNDRAQRLMIYTAASGNGTQEPSGLRAGRTYYNERGRFDVTCEAQVVAGGCDAADTALEELTQELAECVADNRTLDDTVNWVRSTGWTSSTNLLDGGGAVAQITYTFEYDARLT